MSERTALVLGGTGMLKGCTEELLARGWQVVLPCRRPNPEPGAAARSGLGGRGHLPQRQVSVDWARPGDLVASAREALGRPADLLVAWVHASYRETVLRAVAPLLAPGAPVVEVYDSGAVHPVRGVPDPALEGHPTQQVVLGFVRRGAKVRWISHEETSAGVLQAVHRALEGRAPSVHQLGGTDIRVARH